MTRVRTLLIDDSVTARAALRIALSEDPVLEVIGEAADGATARRLISELAPDLITMDVFLRAESGLDLAASIMAAMAKPIVVVTAADVRDPSLVFRAMQAGVLDVCAKLPGPAHPDYEKRRSRLARMLRTLAKVPVVHRTPARSPRVAAAQPHARSGPSRSVDGGAAGGMLLLGASTGGPAVLARLLRALPKPFPLPIAIVQHMVAGFVPGFAKWLADDGGHPVSLVSSSCSIERGVVYLPTAEHHLVIDAGGRVGATQAGPQGFYRPSVDVLFESAAAHLDAARSVGVLLTGMGSDGARGLSSLRKSGAHTIAQDPRTCAVPSMPASAIALGAAERILAPDAMVSVIIEATAAVFMRST